MDDMVFKIDKVMQDIADKKIYMDDKKSSYGDMMNIKKASTNKIVLLFQNEIKSLYYELGFTKADIKRALEKLLKRKIHNSSFYPNAIFVSKDKELDIDEDVSSLMIIDSDIDESKKL